MRVGVLISGRGSNLEALIEGSRRSRYDVTCVISNKPEARGLAVAARNRVQSLVVNPADHSTRRRYDEALARAIDDANLNLIVLAGFMRILGEWFVSRYTGRLLNIHPSLLPRFRGLNTHQRAIDAGDREHGASVHFVSAELDGGPVIAQSTIAVNREDTAQSLADRVLTAEHQLLPHVVGLYAQDRIQLRDSLVFYDGVPLETPLKFP